MQIAVDSVEVEPQTVLSKLNYERRSIPQRLSQRGVIITSKKYLEHSEKFELMKVLNCGTKP
jgi:hypothetical protein